MYYAKKQIQKLEKELAKESRRQGVIVYGSAAIALYRYWGWRRQRLESLFDIVQDVWNECAQDNTVSMIQMLDNETGIELTLRENGRSYKEFDFLNGKLALYNIQNLTAFQMIAMRRGEIQWMGPTIQAALYLALHRKRRFGAERISRLLTQMFEIQDEFENKPHRIQEECLKLTEVDITYTITHLHDDKDEEEEEKPKERSLEEVMQFKEKVNWIDEVKEELRESMN